MKKLGMLICMAGIVLLSAQASNVNIHGNLTGGGVKNPGEPVEVYYDQGYLEVSFLCHLGKLNISVANQSNAVVYDKGVDATEGSSLEIDTTGWSAGVYILSITDGQGGCLEGSFEIF